MSRVQRIRRILAAEYPYRTSDRAIRRVLSVLPNYRARFRPQMDRFIAAVVALPFGGVR